jgi:hypothetical protein
MAIRTMPSGTNYTRRAILGSAPAVAIAAFHASGEAQEAGNKPERRSLSGELGVTTGSFVRHLTVERQPGKLRLLDLPAVMRGELDMHVIDLMTATLPSMTPDYLDRLRTAAEREGCILTNLKMNQRGLDLGTADEELRKRSLVEYKQTVEAAALLGVRWVRPLPGPRRPDLKVLAASYRELIDFAAARHISLLIENFGWMAPDVTAIPEVIAAVGHGLAAQPDTGNWSDNSVRYEGLARAFPLAVSCDFKFQALGPNGEHAAYDLKRCFDIGWKAGFRGPWCFEHTHAELATLYRDLALLRDNIRQWMRK